MLSFCCVPRSDAGLHSSGILVWKGPSQHFLQQSYNFLCYLAVYNKGSLLLTLVGLYCFLDHSRLDWGVSVQFPDGWDTLHLFIVSSATGISLWSQTYLLIGLCVHLSIDFWVLFVFWILILSRFLPLHRLYLCDDS